MNASEKSRVTRYLLGALPDEERDAVEAEYFRNDALFAELKATESELIDDHLAARLRLGLLRLLLDDEGRRSDFAQRLGPASGHDRRSCVEADAGRRSDRSGGVGARHGHGGRDRRGCSRLRVRERRSSAISWRIW